MKFKLIQEFKEFAIKGNMMDIAIGVIIGAAFNKVVDVIVKEIFFPPLSLFTGGVNLEGKRIVLRNEVVENGAVQLEEIAIGYGKLIEAGVDFLIIGLTVFIVVKFMNSLRTKAEDPKNEQESTPKNIELLDKISALMEKQVELLENLQPTNDQRQN
jgi:large conductance mechanosensitive channel